MLQVIQTDQVAFNIPKQYLKDIIHILTSGVLNIRNDKAILHFDSSGLRVIEKSDKHVIPFDK